MFGRACSRRFAAREFQPLRPRRQYVSGHPVFLLASGFGAGPLRPALSGGLLEGVMGLVSDVDWSQSWGLR